MSAAAYRFGPFLAERAGYRVLRGGEIVDLTPKLLDLLLHLLDRAGTLVTKDELLEALWPGANVTENALAQAMSELRQALGDDAASPQFIKTVARRGYRFIAPVENIENIENLEHVERRDATRARAPGSGDRSIASPAKQDTHDVENERTIAVMDFVNVTGDADSAWLSAGIAEAVTGDLRSLGSFRVVDRWRVMEAARRTSGTLQQVAADLRARLAVVGSFQRKGDRITARVVEVDSGEALADAKVDGPLETIFALQDQVVAQFSADLGVRSVPSTDAGPRRDTPSLDAFRAFSEASVRLESLDVREMPQAIADFERAAAADPRYTLAYTGLAAAEFALYESTRWENEPAIDLLNRAAEHARHAAQLDETLAEAHATLALVLVSAWQTNEAALSARRAVALEPSNWRHLFRLGSFMFDVWQDRLWLIGIIVIGVAVAGTALSFRIPHVPAARGPAAPGAHIDRNPWREIGLGLKRLRADRVLWLTVLGISYFWFLGSLLQTVMILFGSQVMGLGDRWIGILVTFAAIGIGIGSMVAGRLSGDKVELGLAPIGSIGMGAFAIVLSRSGHSFTLAAINLALVGFFGGLFAVPLNALLQQRSGDQEKGRLMATNNFLNTVGILLSAGALWLFGTVLGLSPDRVVLVFGIITLISSVYVLAVVPEFLIRFSLWLLTHTIYRIRIVGQEHVPFRGPALLVCNHLSHIDGFLVGACVQRFIRFMVYRPIYEHWALHRPLKLMKAIPVAAGRDAVASLEQARRELQDGHVVCIFAEGAISRTGNMLPFKRGFERIAEGLDVPVIPVYLDQVWGSIFSFKGGRFFWKRPVRVPYPVTVAFGAPLSSDASAAEARLALMELGADVAMQRRPANEVLGRQFVRTAKHTWFSFCMADSSKRRLTFGNALVASLLLSRWIRRRSPNEPNIGLLLPASVGGALANIATSLAGKVPVNLNFTAGREAMAIAIERCEIEDEIRAQLDEHHTSVVTAVPDATKGERLVAFYTDPDVTPQELWERLTRTELPKLWVPKRDDLHFVETIPTLGTAKTDLRAVRQLAIERSSTVGTR